MPLIPALRGRGRRISELETSLVYRASFRTARATQRNPVSKNQRQGVCVLGGEKIAAITVGASVLDRLPVSLCSWVSEEMVRPW